MKKENVKCQCGVVFVRKKQSRKYRCDKCKKIFEHLPSHLRNYPTKNCYHIKKPKPIRIIKGYIYLIQVHKYFKIGKTLDIKMRIRKYIAENPYEIKVIIFKKVKNYTKAETQLLKKFRKKKYRNEWFLLNENDTRVLKDFLDKLK